MVQLTNGQEQNRNILGDSLEHIKVYFQRGNKITFSLALRDAFIKSFQKQLKKLLKEKSTKAFVSHNK